MNLSPVLGFPAVLFIKFQGDPRMHLCVEVNTTLTSASLLCNFTKKKIFLQLEVA